MNNISKLTVGAEVGYGRWHWGTALNSGFARVSKINGFGHITLDNGMVFDKYGKERDVKCGGCQLVDADALHEMNDRAAMRRERKNKIDQLHKLMEQLAAGENGSELKNQMIQLIEGIE